MKGQHFTGLCPYIAMEDCEGIFWSLNGCSCSPIYIKVCARNQEILHFSALDCEFHRRLAILAPHTFFRCLRDSML